jgi:anti-sigma B factor antagonist
MPHHPNFRRMTRQGDAMEQQQKGLAVEYGLDTTFVTLVDYKILDERQISRLRESFEPVIERNDSGRMVINFDNVAFMSSAMLGLLVRVHKRVAEHGGTLKLVNLDPSLRKVFEITRLSSIFEIS